MQRSKVLNEQDSVFYRRNIEEKNASFSPTKKSSTEWLEDDIKWGF